MKNRIFIMLSFFIGIIVVIFLVNQILILRKAHSTFKNYYSFRNCVKLLKKTPDYGLCKTNTGEEIKIVKFNNKWYLNGDLPFCVSTFCL